MQRRLFGAFLVAEGYVTDAQLALALEHQRRLRETRLGDILVAQGAIPRPLLERAALDQLEGAGARRARIGEFLLGEGLIGQIDLTRALAQQERDRGKRLGEVLLELGFLDADALSQAVRAQLEDHYHDR
jgi:type IV pilus assembly protein PilB